jgi:hypothetical protein
VTLAAGPFAITSLLLFAAGVAKCASPGDTANALAATGAPISRTLVRVGGAFEALVGVYAFVEGDRVGAILVAASYAIFAVFIVLALVRHLPIATCGCFGKADTPPSAVHVVFDLAAVVAAVTVALDPPAGIADVLGSQPLAGVPYLFLVLTGAFISFLALGALPRLLVQVREAQ